MDGLRARTLLRAHTRRLGANGGGVITRTALPGGLRVVSEEMPGVRSASIGIWVPVGSRDETHSLAGTSHFLEHLLFKGTSHRSALEIASAMDAVGGEFNAFTEKEHTCYYATVLDRDLALAVDLVADVVLNATIAAADVDVERNVVLEEIAMRDDDPTDLVHEVFSAAMFGDAPLGRPILGTVESIAGLSRTQVAGYYRRRYTPEAMVVSIAGNVRHAEVVRLVRRAFVDRLRPDLEPRRPRATREPEHVMPATPMRVVRAETEQANVIVGGYGVSRHDPRRYAVGVLSSGLGGGTSSRLFQQVREQRGLAYSIYSFSGMYTDTGQFGVYAGCQPERANEVLGLIIDELDAVAKDGLTEAEVERGKGQMRGGVVLGLEDCASRMNRLGKSELVYGDVLGVDEIVSRIDAVTVDDVAAAAAELLTRPRCLTVIGPFGEHDFDGAL